MAFGRGSEEGIERRPVRVRWDVKEKTSRMR